MGIFIDIHQFPCLNDNYGYLVHEGSSGETAAIDTPDADRYLAEAKRRGWTITQVWNTHWHPDHAGGNLRLKEVTGCRIIGPEGEASKIPGIDQAVKGGDVVSLGEAKASVIDVPGHTLGHIAFHFADQSAAFVGDSIFALGCGRVFEGTMEMMWQSLKRLKALPPKTQLYCAHEYTASNAKFALHADPDNVALKAYADEVTDKRSRGEWTVPTRLDKELAANPFLRADVPDMQARWAKYGGKAGDAVATFAALRAAKDNF